MQVGRLPLFKYPRKYVRSSGTWRIDRNFHCLRASLNVASQNLVTGDTDPSIRRFCSCTMSPKHQLKNSLRTIDKKVTSALHSRLAVIHSNETSLKKQAKSLRSLTKESRVQQDKWNGLVCSGRNGLKVGGFTSGPDFRTQIRNNLVSSVVSTSETQNLWDELIRMSEI
jgi:GCN5-like protein 1 (GCN5L1)